MKVLLGHCFYRSSAPSGEDSVFKNEKELLRLNGVDVVLLEKFNDNVNVANFFDSLKTAFKTTWSSASYKEVVAIIKKHNPDVAHFHNTFPQLSPSVYKACHDCGVPVIQTLHNYRLVCPGGMLLRDGKSCELCLNGSVFPTKSLKYRCYRDSLLATGALAMMVARNRMNGSYQKYVDRYIALTDFAKVRFIRGGLPEGKLTVKPNFLPVTPDIQISKENYAVFVGRLSDEKGIRTLLEAWRNIDGCKLKVLGDGHLRAELEEIVNKKNINVEFLGFKTQAEVLDIVAKAIVQIIPSECYEGFPMSVLEAFSCNTPVIASRLGSLGEIINDGRDGILFEPKNSKDLSEKIISLLNDGVLRNKLAVQARTEFESKYTDKANIKMLIEIYKDSIKK